MNQLHKRNILFTSLLISICIGIIKFTAYFITHSNAILSDALESIINVIAGIFALYSVILAAKPKDIDHPYGHGKIEFLSTGFEGTLIMLAGASMIFKSVYNLFYPQNLQLTNTGFYLIIFSGIANFLLGKYLERKGKELQSLTIESDGKHISSDAYSSIGIIIGLFLIYITGLYWLDNIIAILFGILIIITGFKLIRKSLAGIMDEADHQELDQIIQIINTKRKSEWIDIHNMRLIKYGSDLHIDCHVTLPWYSNLNDAHEQIKQIEELIATKTENTVEVFIHADPCLPTSCSICLIKNCNVRQFPFKEKLEWNLKNLIENKKHEI